MTIASIQAVGKRTESVNLPYKGATGVSYGTKRLGETTPSPHHILPTAYSCNVSVLTFSKAPQSSRITRCRRSLCKPPMNAVCTSAHAAALPARTSRQRASRARRAAPAQVSTSPWKGRKNSLTTTGVVYWLGFARGGGGADSEHLRIELRKLRDIHYGCRQA
jgi:hypothetical protein